MYYLVILTPMSVLSQLPLIFIDHVFLFLSFLIIFDCMPDIVNFTLLSAGYFSILITILEFCSRLI